MKSYYVYLMTNKTKTVLYTGVTNNLIKRTYEHRHGLIDGFTKKYNVKYLMYYESTVDIRSAIQREKEIKGWVRAKKNALIATNNPEWKDLASLL